ncbi:MAG: hypothetical protein WCA46_09895 [Actinocatenispora sp.]
MTDAMAERFLRDGFVKLDRAFPAETDPAIFYAARGFLRIRPRFTRARSMAVNDGNSANHLLGLTMWVAAECANRPAHARRV